MKKDINKLKVELILDATHLIKCVPLMNIQYMCEGQKSISTRKLNGMLNELENYLKIKGVKVGNVARSL